MQYKDYYKILGVEKTATDSQIKSAYRKLAKKFHPDVDKSKSASEKFKDINEAYEVLSDKEKRNRYDNLGSNWQNGSEFTPPPGWENLNRGNSRTYTSSDFGGFENLGGFSDFFRTIFSDMMFSEQRTTGSRGTENYYSNFDNRYSRKSSGQNKTRKPENLDMTEVVSVSAKDLMESNSVRVEVSAIEKCTECNADGTLCYKCGGTGIAKNTRTLNVKIPYGVKEGQKIRLKGEGKLSTNGQRGDLYLIITFKDSEYQIDGSNLTKVIDITPSQAVLGTNKEIKTLHGKINIKIPKSSQNGTVLRSKNLGLPMDKNNNFGNFNVKININIPKNLSNEEIELYKQLDEIEKIKGK